ncbi:hypothetical protein OUZ56_013679 [Daphnia magna]|uniref:Uncharacterized protein n=1 Tax=Daphnia magna TaxID=35525 RepID=A0ABQ9Z6L1_9CRUS|nr:hypothetical protein OUZ56_013679 [Daphnia magna]
MDDILGFLIFCLFLLVLYLNWTQDRIYINCSCQYDYNSGTNSNRFFHTIPEEVTETEPTDLQEELPELTTVQVDFIGTNHVTILPEYGTLMEMEPLRLKVNRVNTILDSMKMQLKAALEDQRNKKNCVEKGSVQRTWLRVESTVQPSEPHADKLQKRPSTKSRRAPLPPVDIKPELTGDQDTPEIGVPDNLPKTIMPVLAPGLKRLRPDSAVNDPTKITKKKNMFEKLRSKWKQWKAVPSKKPRVSVSFLLESDTSDDISPQFKTKEEPPAELAKPDDASKVTDDHVEQQRNGRAQ